MKTELAIVGAGPAGMAAAEVAARYGIDVVVIDEQSRPGGQILRQPPAQFRVDRWLTHHVYQAPRKLLQASTSQDGIRWLHRTSVLGIFSRDQEHELQLSTSDGMTELVSPRVLIATGCYDMPLSFPGSTLPGVMATGGIQAFIKSQQIVPGQRFVFAGSHPLQLIVADQVMQAGGTVAAVVFSQPLGTFWQVLRHCGAMLRYPDKMLYLAGACLRLIRNRVPVKIGSTVSSANGDTELQSVDIMPVASPDPDSQRERFECDRLGICFNFLASTDLLRQAGARCHWSEASGGWLADHDEWMRTSVPGIYVGGEVSGVAGADVAHQEGLIAGYATAMDAGRISQHRADRLSARPRRKLRHAQKFANALSALSWPGTALIRKLMTDDSVLCKCEEVTVGQLREMLDNSPLTRDMNAIKLLSRCGMGPCQGRYCSFQLATLLTSDYGLSPDDYGTYKARFPVKPVAIECLLKESADPETNDFTSVP